MADTIIDIKDYSSYHLTDSNSDQLYEPARNNAFVFTVSDKLNDLLPAGSSENTDNYYLTNMQETLKVAVASASVPTFELSTIEVRRGNSVIKFAGQPTFNSGSIKLNDFVGARVKDMLLAWQALAYDVTKDVVHAATNYKFDCTLTEYSVDYSKKIRSWTLKGCWISNIDDAEFTHESSDKRTLTATVQFDRAIPEIDTSNYQTNIKSK